MRLSVVLLISSLTGFVTGLFLMIHILAKQTREIWGSIPDRLEDNNNVK